MPRVLCYLHSFAPGGVECMAVRLCEAWASNGVEVELVMGRAEGRIGAGSACAHRDVVWLPIRWLPDPGFPTKWFETLWMTLWLPGIVRRSAPDLLFCAGNSYTVVAVALRLLLNRRCPFIVAKISNDLDRRDMRPPARLLYHRWCRIQGRLIDRFVVLSGAGRVEACERLGVSPSRIVIIPDPVLTDREGAELAAAGRLAALSRADRAPGRRFLAVGRLERQKNFPLLIQAFARGAGPADRLVVLGEGSRRPSLVRLIRRLGLADRVVLPGHSGRVADWFARSDVFVLSSDYEGLPAVLIEALASGIPIIATDCCRAMRETVAGIGRVRLVPVRDRTSLADAIATFDPERSIDGADYSLRFRPRSPGRAYARLFRAVVEPIRAADPIAALANPPTNPRADLVPHPRVLADLASRGARTP